MEHHRWMYRRESRRCAAVSARKGLFERVGLDEYPAAVYLFDDPRDAEEWPGERTLIVDAGGLALKWDAYGSFDKWGWAWRCEGPIPAARVRLRQ